MRSINIMAWNESGNGKDPWKRDGEGPQDLDQIVQEWQRRFSSLFGGAAAAVAVARVGWFWL